MQASVIGRGILFAAPITRHDEFLSCVIMLYTKCPPPSSFGRRYMPSKVRITSTSLEVSPLTPYTQVPGGYGGSFILLPVTMCLADMTGCTPPGRLIELTILTVENTSSLINLCGIFFTCFGIMDRTHLILSLINRIPLSTNWTCALASQQLRVIPSSLSSVLHDTKARSAYTMTILNPRSV